MKEDVYVGFKIQLYPTEEQKILFEKYFNMSRTVYNLGIHIHDSYYKENKYNEDCKYKSLSAIGMRNILMEMRNTNSRYNWLKEFNRESIMSVLKDVATAFKRFSTGQNNFPKFKKKKCNNHKSFPTRDDRLSVYKDTVKISSIGYVKCSNSYGIIGTGNKNKNMNYLHFINSRVIYNGCNYYLAFYLKESSEIHINSFKNYLGRENYRNKSPTNPVGIDLGCKKDNWIVDSLGNKISHPDISKEEKKIKTLTKKFTRQYNTNNNFKGKKTNSTLTNKSKEVYTKNQQKTLNKLNKYYKKISNKNKNTIYEYSNILLNAKPEYVVLEDICEKDMLIQDKNISSIYKNRHNRLVKNAMIYTVQKIISYKCENNNIPVIFADRNFPSTKLCSSCGNEIEIGTKRIYKCPNCGLIIDRDLNAALNLAHYIKIG